MRLFEPRTCNQLIKSLVRETPFKYSWTFPVVGESNSNHKYVKQYVLPSDVCTPCSTYKYRCVDNLINDLKHFRPAESSRMAGDYKGVQ